MYPEKKYDFLHETQNEMKRLSKYAISSVYGKVDPRKRENSFEVLYLAINTHIFQIFGLDFMIDRDFKVWLIEINTNPCLETNCPLLQRLIPTMVEHAF